MNGKIVSNEWSEQRHEKENNKKYSTNNTCLNEYENWIVGWRQHKITHFGRISNNKQRETTKRSQQKKKIMKHMMERNTKYNK